MLFTLAYITKSNLNSQDALYMVLTTTENQTPVLGIQLNNWWYMQNVDRINALRDVELAAYVANGDGFQTLMIFDQKAASIESSLYSIYTTLFVIVLLVVSSVSS